MKNIIILILILTSLHVKGQELWQLSPWATDSTYVLGALSSGEPTWVQINGVATRIDSITYANDTLYVYTPDTTLKAEIVGGSGLLGSAATNRVAFGQSTDTLTYDSLFYFNPSNNVLGIGTSSPNSAGALGGIHVNSNFFTGVHLTNNQTGTTASDGTEFYIYGDTLYISNRENGKIELATNGASRMTITGAGRVGVNTANPSTTLHVTGETTISSLASGGSAPTTSGTTVKVISDANGKLSFQTNNTGTVTSVGLTTGTSGTDVSVSGSPITSSGNITLNIPTASGSNTGKLSSTDWTTFNNKFTLPSLTSGSVLFSNGTTISQNNTKFFWNNSTERLGIGTASPSMPLHVEGRGYFNQGSSNLFLNGGNTTLSGSSNFALGGSTLTSLTTGYQNIGIGVGAAPLIQTGYANFAMGSQALNACVGCYGNISIGNQSLFTNVSGFRNIAIGQEALAFTTTDASTAIGFYALRGQTTGLYNTGVGYFAAYQNQTGSGNVSDGFFSGPVSGGNNVMVGYYAGSGTTGSSNVILGNQSGGGTQTQSNRLYIENSSGTTPLIGGYFDTDRVGINTPIASITRTLHVTGEARITDLTTDTPTGLVGADADGDLGTVSTGNGVTLSSGSLGLTGQALAVHNLSSNGLIARTSSGNVSARTITAGDGISITNGDGVSGNPTIVSASSQYAQLHYAGQTTVTANTAALLSAANYTTLNYTSNGSFTNSATNRIRCDFTGTVQIIIDATWQGGDGSATTHSLNVYVNGSGAAGYPSISANSVALSGTTRAQHSYRNGQIISVTNGDYFEFYYTAPSSTTLVLPLLTIRRLN